MTGLTAYSVQYHQHSRSQHYSHVQRLKDVLKVDNIHQDGGIHYFSKNGYQSRMVTVWTNIYKDDIAGLSKSDLGIFVIENDETSNQSVYEKMVKENTHFISKRKGELMDNMYIAGSLIKCDTDKLKRRYFDFKKGTSIFLTVISFMVQKAMIMIQTNTLLKILINLECH